jgi:hypothetical protein
MPWNMWNNGGIAPPFLTSAVDGDEWSDSNPRGKSPGTHWIGGCTKSNPGRPTHNLSLYQLSRKWDETFDCWRTTRRYTPTDRTLQISIHNWYRFQLCFQTNTSETGNDRLSVRLKPIYAYHCTNHSVVDEALIILGSHSDRLHKLGLAQSV